MKLAMAAFVSAFLMVGTADARLTERGAVGPAGEEVSDGSSGFSGRDSVLLSAAVVRGGPPRSVNRARPPLLAGEKPWHATYQNPVNRNLIRLARCETGYLSGRRINWAHHNGTYSGGLGFAHSTWTQFRREVRPLPPSVAARATPLQQLAVGRALVRRFGGYSSWPACHRRLGIY